MNKNGYDGRVIQWALDNSGWSKFELARRSNCDVGTIYNALASENITTKTLKSICAALRLDRSVVVRDDLKKDDFSLAVLNGDSEGSRRRV